LLTPPPLWWFSIVLLFPLCSSSGTERVESLLLPRQAFRPMMLVGQAPCNATTTFCVPPFVHSLRTSFQSYPCLGISQASTRAWSPRELVPVSGQLASSVSRSLVKTGRPGNYHLTAEHSMANGTSLIGFWIVIRIVSGRSSSMRVLALITKSLDDL
jgi:hypothetical protein